MTLSKIKTTAAAALVALGALTAVTAAEAGGKGKEYFSNDYYFDQAMNGKQGFEGAYYCSYVKQPVDVTMPNGKKKRVWKLTQSCY